MKCPNCGSELRKGLSFCPKCGNVVSQNKQEVASAQKSQSVQPQKRTSVWKIVLGILFFPIALTIIIVKNKKMKPIMKIMLIAILWIVVLVIGASNSNVTPTSNDNSISDSSYEEKVDDETATSNGSEQLAHPESEEADTVKYHDNEYINRLFTAYNAIAEYPITPEMIEDEDDYKHYKAYISCNGVWIAIHATSDNGMFVDYDDEAANDGAIQPIFRDFCKALNSDITNKDVNSAWEILQTEEYQNYSPYDLEGIECTYSESPLSNGEHRYIVKTNCKSYCS